jgi:ethanolamine ammonia-lyase small subunit
VVPVLRAAGWRIAPVCLVRYGRVALGDAVGAALGVRLIVVLIGERPGLTAPDSLGAYLTYHPCPGRSDAERNCLSNIRPAGMPIGEAARRLLWHLGAASARGLTGVALKDESESNRSVDARPPGRLGPPQQGGSQEES